MPTLTDKHQIRTILRGDPRWCVYALGDLSPRMFPKCQWFTPDLTLVLHDYGTSILFAHGTGSIREALEHVTWPVHLQVQQDALDEVERYANVTSIKSMIRMAWAAAHQGQRSRHTPIGGRRSGDRASVCRRRITGESPDFFYASMVTDGVFFGVYRATI